MIPTREMATVCLFLPNVTFPALNDLVPREPWHLVKMSCIHGAAGNLPELAGK